MVSALCALAPARASGQLSFLETDDLDLVYFDPALAYLAPHAGRCFENAMAFQRDVVGFTPSERVSVLLKDYSDWGNAAAGAVPRDQLQFDVGPMDYSFESFVAPERMYMLMNHELTHVATMDKAAPGDTLFRTLFRGKVRPLDEHPETMLYAYLTAPRTAAPRWYSEGTAVFHETWLSGGIGRAQGSYDEMVFRAMVRDGSRFYDPLGLVSEGVKTSFQVEANSYLYGTRFISYLALQHSPQAILDWVYRSEGSKRYYAAQFEQVFGMPLSEAWQDWIGWEHEFQEENLARIREFPVTPTEDLSPRALGSVSRAFLNPAGDKLYLGFNYPGVVAHIGALSLEDGSLERILEIKRAGGYSVTSLAYDRSAEKLYYTTDNRALRDLRVLDPATGESQTLIKDGRIGDLVFRQSDRSLFGLRHLNGIVTLVRIPEPYAEWNQVRSWPYGEVLYNLDLSPDGELLSAGMAELSGHYFLRVWRVAELGGDGPLPEPVAELDLGTSIPLDFVFSSDGRFLYGSSYYTGVANIFRFEIATQELEAVTNTETGLFRPIPMADGSIIAFRYTGEGFVPARIEGAVPIEDVNAIHFLGQQTIAAHPSLAEWRVGSPARVPLDSLVTSRGEYKSSQHLGLESVYPILEGYKDSAAYGFRLNLSDFFVLLEGSVVASYSPDEELPSDERLHLALQFRQRNWTADAKLNDADFYDLFGPTKKSLKGYSLGLGYDRFLIWDQPREMELQVKVAHYGDLERLPDFQNVSVQFDALTRATARLHYENLRSSLGFVDDEKGFQWDIVASTDYVNADVIPSVMANFDFGVPAGLEHSSIWLRSSVGSAFGDLDDPFSNFFFGGFGNNYVDHQEVKRYREYYALPGLEINEAGGRTFARALLEWNLPPIRFRRAGSPGFYLTWARPALFATGLMLNPEESGDVRRTLGSIGAQIDFRITVLSNLDLTVSLGYASAVEEGFGPRDEFMISLKLF